MLSCFFEKERKTMMQQLINLINQNQDLSDNFNLFLMLLIFFGTLIVFLELYTVIKEKSILTKNNLKKHIVITVTAFTMVLVSVGFDAHQHYVAHNQIKANNAKIERIERTTINSQTSKYPYCVSMERSSFWNSTQILVFFNNQQNAINFIQKNQNYKHIFLPDYLKSDSDFYLSQESNQSIENNFNQMQVEPTKRALTQMIDESKNN